MKTKTALFILIIILLSACNGQQAALPTITAAESVSATAEDASLAVAFLSEERNPQSNVEFVSVTQTQPQTAVSTNPQPIAQADCPTQNFINVAADPANSAYAAPEINVTCTATTMIVASNGIPGYEFVSLTPNGLSTQNYRYEIPLNPVAAETETTVPLLGAIGFAVNGMPIFAPNEAPRDNYGDAYLDGLLDYCNGHTAQGGMYHYHARPDCLFENIEGNPYLVIGYGFDGYPILAPYACTDTACTNVVKIESSYQQTGDGYQRGDNTWESHTYVVNLSPLDECNGMTLANGSYAYFATDTFPYFLGCYHGVVTNNNQPAGQNQSAITNPQPGQTNVGTPEQPAPDTQTQPQRPDFAAAAQQLGISEQALINALGQGRPNLEQAAISLGISVDILTQALGIPSPTQARPPRNG